MGFLRFLLIAILVLVAVRVLRAAFRPPPRSPAARPGAAEAPRQIPERLVKDPVCGLLLPESQALREGDGYFCSEECRRAAHAR